MCSRYSDSAAAHTKRPLRRCARCGAMAARTTATNHRARRPACGFFSFLLLSPQTAYLIHATVSNLTRIENSLQAVRNRVRACVRAYVLYPLRPPRCDDAAELQARNAVASVERIASRSAPFRDPGSAPHGWPQRPNPCLPPNTNTQRAAAGPAFLPRPYVRFIPGDDHPPSFPSSLRLLLPPLLRLLLLPLPSEILISHASTAHLHRYLMMAM